MQRTTLQMFNFLQDVAGKYLGRRFVMTSGDRDCQRQLEISGSNSFHLVGHAFDAVIQPFDPDYQWILGQVAKEFGWRWGGDFAKYDPVHFDNGRRYRPGHC